MASFPGENPSMQSSVDDTINQLLNQRLAGENTGSARQHPQMLTSAKQLEYLLRDPYLGRYLPQHETMHNPGIDKALLDANIRGIPDAYTPSFRMSTRKGYIELEPFYWN